MIGDKTKPERHLKLATAAITNMPDKMGAPGSKSLFIEFNDGTTDIKPIYSIKEFHKKFVQIGDLTEYKAAIELCGTWDQWNRIKTRWKSFAVIIEEWKDEIRTRLISEAQDQILSVMRDGSDGNKLAAAKWIAEQGWDKTNVKKSPAAKSKERYELSQIAKVPDEDMQRIEKMLEMRDKEKVVNE